MALRRPRIKPVANIGGIKRKKAEVNEKLPNSISLQSQEVSAHDKTEIENDNTSNQKESKSQEMKIQNQIEKLPNPSLPTSNGKPVNDLNQKSRHKIRPTPCFDTRRNSVSNTTGITHCMGPSMVGGNTTSNKNAVHCNENLEKYSSKENILQKGLGNRTPSRIHRISESMNGSSLMSPPAHIHNSPNFQNINNHTEVKHQMQNHFTNNGQSYSTTPTKEHIPPRIRKFSAMDDVQKLSSARREFNSKYSQMSPEKSTLTICDFIFYNPSTNPMVFEKKVEKSENIVSEEELPSISDIEKEEQANEEHGPVPQLRVGPNGEIILDEKSLTIETTLEKKAKTTLATSKTAIYIDEYSSNNGFYSRQKRTKEWTSDETLKFYRCLHTIGTDFSMMISLFPGRSRRDLKLKFKKEERNNELLINKALLQPNTFDIEHLKNELARADEALKEKQQEEIEKKVNKRKLDEKIKYVSKQREEIGSGYSRDRNVLSKGDFVYEIENKVDLQKRRRRGSDYTAPDIPSDPLFTPKMDNTQENEPVNIQQENKNESTFLQKSSDVITQIDMGVDDVIPSTSINVLSNDDSIIEITDIGNLLPLEEVTNIQNSTLALVTKRDAVNPGRTTHGIYILCRTTGVMSQKPLDLPADTIHCILHAMENP